MTTLGALEHRVGCNIPNNHVIFMCLVKHSASVHIWHQMGDDGRAPWEGGAGGRSERPVADFGEGVMFMTKGPNKGHMWSFGVWLGVAPRSQDVYVGAS